jgi:hypothetical protein
VPTTANGNFEPQLVREVDGIGYVRRVTTSGDQSWALVHETVMDPSGFLIPRICRLQELPRERAGEVYDGAGNG